MFCPNCGTQNQDAATTCSKCGFNLKGAAAPKFKGTMLMMNAPAGIPRPGSGAPPAAAPAQPAAPADPAASAAGTAPDAAAATSPSVKPKLKGTMLGVAPPSLGSAPSPGGAPGAAPIANAPVAGSPPAGVPLGAGAPEAAPMAPAQADSAPDPLGGTVVAGAGFPGAPAPMPGQVAGIPGATPGMPGVAPGMPGPAPGMPGPAPGMPGVAPGMPGVAPGMPGPAPGMPGPAPGMPGPAPAGPGMAPAPGASPGAPDGAVLAAGPGAVAGMAMGGPMQPAGVGAVAGHGPVGTTRNWIMVFLGLGLCGIPGILYLYNMVKELNEFRRKDDANFFMCLIYIGWFSMPEKILEAKKMAGIANPQVQNAILYLFGWFYFLPEDLNEIWKAAGGQAR